VAAKEGGGAGWFYGGAEEDLGKWTNCRKKRAPQLYQSAGLKPKPPHPVAFARHLGRRATHRAALPPTLPSP
jgi:hypothetical protein